MSSSNYIWHPFSPLHNNAEIPQVVSARDSVLTLADGTTLIDAIASWWVITHGHANERITEAISVQAKKLDHVLFAGFTHEPAEQLSEQIRAISPVQNPYVYFSDNGSTSVEVAVKIAWQCWKNQGIKKSKIIAFENAYHGDTFGSMSVGGNSLFNSAFSELMFKVDHVSLPNEKDHKINIIDFEQVCSAGNVAAFIYEPLVQGAAGMRMYPPSLLDDYLRIAKKNNIICIADEVMTGFGRTGKMFASDYLTLKPDLVCLSKGLTGGVLPLGITLVSETVAEVFKNVAPEKRFYHGHSFTANPIACAAAVANIKQMDTVFFDRLNRIETAHRKFSDQIKNHPLVLDVRCTGTVLAVELKQENKGYLSPLRDEMYSYFIKKGLLLRPLGNVVYVLPPYCTSNAELEMIYSGINSFLNR